jgi:hypothetical protein
MKDIMNVLITCMHYPIILIIINHDIFIFPNIYIMYHNACFCKSQVHRMKKSVYIYE